jgi:hypothetical protein
VGKHYLPQKYLLGFEDPRRPGFIWQFDKKSGKFTETAVSIKNVAQERSFYETETEAQLNQLVEIPGNAVIEKLGSSLEISEEDRVNLSVYVATMIKRVPRQRERGHKLLPKALAKAVHGVREEIEAHRDSGRLASSIAAKRLAELDAAESMLQISTPGNIIEEIQNPFPDHRLVQLVFDMQWRFIRAKGPSFFLTGDNPAYFFEGLGLANKTSELIFPVNYQLAIHGSLQPASIGRVVCLDQRVVREINRRIVSGAVRFVFYRDNADWVSTLASKSDVFLSRINWS